jgi:hypothetical protein
MRRSFLSGWLVLLSCCGLANVGCGGQSGASGGGDSGGPGQKQCGGPVQGKIGELDGQPVAIAVAGCDVYVALSPGGIVEMPMAGGAVRSLVASTGSDVFFQNPFAMTNGDFFFSESSGGNMPGPIASAPLGGGKATTLATSMGFTSGIAVDANNVYWTAQDGGMIESVPVGGGTPTILASHLTGPAGLALQDGTLYFMDTSGDLLSVPASGGAVKTLYKGPGLAPDTEIADWSPAIALDAENLYFSVCSGLQGAASPSLYRLPLAGGSPVALASSCARGIAVDGTDVYWTDGSRVSSVPAAGGTTRTLYSGPSPVSGGPVLDATSVYWGVAKDEVTCGLCSPPPAGQFNGVMRAAK